MARYKISNEKGREMFNEKSKQEEINKAKQKRRKGQERKLMKEERSSEGEETKNNPVHLNHLNICPSQTNVMHSVTYY